MEIVTMNTLIEIKLNHSSKEVAKISQKMELPNVFGDEGKKSHIKLTDLITVTENLHVAGIDLETKVVTLQKHWGIDISDFVNKENVDQFFVALQEKGWSVEVNQAAIDKLNEPPKTKKTIKNEKIVEVKPKLISAFYSFILISLVFTVCTYLFNNEKFHWSYIVPALPMILIAVFIGHWFALRKYNKANEDLKKSTDEENSPLNKSHQ